MTCARMGAIVLALVASAFVIGVAASAASSRVREAGCLAAPVHYGPSPNRGMPRIPWVSAGHVGRRIFGYLFYYAELPRTRRMTIYPGGELPGGKASTKILWFSQKVRASVMTITGERLDRPGGFTQQLSAARAGATPVFPSIVNVPTAGCWRLTVSSGPGVSARFAVLALPK